MLEHLHRQVGRASETIEPNGRTRRDARAFDRSEADDARAEQRRRMLVVDRIGQTVGKIFAHDGLLGISAIAIPSGKACVGAEILAAFAAVSAATVGFAQPCDADPIADFEAPAPGTQAFDHTDDLVSGNDSGMFAGKIALDEVQVGPANAAGRDAHRNLSRSRNRRRLFDQSQRLGFDGRWV